MSSKNGPGAKIYPTSFWLDEEAKDTLARLVKDLGLNRSQVVREALRRMVADDRTAEVRHLVAQLERAVTGGGDV